ncbi:MAG: RNA polymerase sigma-70 factor [Odoribacter sp.]
MEESQFIERLNRKQAEAYRVLFRVYHRALILYAMGYAVSQEVAEDAAQEVFVALYEGRMTFQSEVALRSFLYKSVRNNILNYLKHQKIEQYYAAKNEDWEPEDDKVEIELKILKEEVYRRVFAVLDTLPEQCHRIFEMHLNGRNNEEIASLLHLSIHTVKTQKKRAMQQLRGQIGNFYGWCLLFFPI